VADLIAIGEHHAETGTQRTKLLVWQAG
jgi:hypothetical protein